MLNIIIKNLFIIKIYLLTTISFLLSQQVFVPTSALLKSEITITETTPLSFGSISLSTDRNSSSTTFFLKGNNTFGVVESGVNQRYYSNAPKTGRYTVKGDAGASVNLSVSSSTELRNGPTSIVLILEIISGNQVQLDTRGVKLIQVGGKIIVPKNFTSGVYTGSFNINASY